MTKNKKQPQRKKKKIDTSNSTESFQNEKDQLTSKLQQKKKKNNNNNTKKKNNCSFGMLTIVGSIVVIVIGVLLASLDLQDELHTITVNNNNNEQIGQDQKQQQQQQQQNPLSAKSRAKTKFGPFYELIQQVPHDPMCFTQGLVTYYNKTLNKDIILEGTGMYGESMIRSYDPMTETIYQQYDMDSKYFGEGMCLYKNITNNKESLLLLIQLTWKESVGFIYDPKTFKVIESFSYTTTTNEGWGITYRDTTNEFYVSDGSSWIIIWDPITKQEKRRIQVVYDRPSQKGGGVQHDTTTITEPVPIGYINELEWDPSTDTILANVWYQNVILRIDSDSGHVQTIYDFTKLYENRTRQSDSFNGIALTNVANEIWVTGKYWPYLYRVKLLQ